MRLRLRGLFFSQAERKDRTLLNVIMTNRHYSKRNKKICFWTKEFHLFPFPPNKANFTLSFLFPLHIHTTRQAVWIYSPLFLLLHKANFLSSLLAGDLSERRKWQTDRRWGGGRRRKKYEEEGGERQSRVIRIKPRTWLISLLTVRK